MAQQFSNQIMMVRPASFQFNAQTAVSNTFQQELKNLTEAEIKTKAIAEFDAYVAKLKAVGVDVLVIEDTPEPAKPDAVFPNNWISMQADGKIYIYPMCTPNRRLEKREDVVQQLNDMFDVQEVVDLSSYENENIFLEGTGSIIFDHLNKTAYACLSPRTDKMLFEKHCASLGYKAVSFKSADKNGNLVYHTNVMLTIGDGFAVICTESFVDENERNYVKQQLQDTHHELIEISFEQMNQFAGNMLEVAGENGKSYLVMSESAFLSLSQQQRDIIQKYCEILSVPIPTIETIGGGSARCMLAEIFLKKK